MNDVRTKKKAERPFQTHRFVLNLEREELYQRIDQRVIEMMHAGLLEEAKSVFQKKELKSLKTVGYQELFAHLEGKIDLPTAISQIQQNSRRYAKRQLTWFRKNKENIWLKSKTTEERKKEILHFLHEGQAISPLFQRKYPTS